MEKILLKVLGLSYSQSQTGAYALVLEEVQGKRRIPILISGFEAQAIAVELESINMGRPLTHDLFKSFALGFNITIKQAVIHKLEEGIFYAKLICSDGNKTIELDSRTSDAVAIALRFKCPIFTYENILSSSGLSNEADADNESKEAKDNDFGLDDDFETSIIESVQEVEMPIEELQKLLDKAIEEEDYERASELRDYIESKKGNK